MPSPEAMLFWRYITSSIDELLATLEGLSAQELNWSPLVNANSLYALATHTLGNSAEHMGQAFLTRDLILARRSDIRE